MLNKVNELEQRMANILTELKIKFVAQHGIDRQCSEAKCNSRYPSCHFRGNSGEYEQAICRDEDYAIDSECEWFQDGRIYYRYVLDFAIFYKNRQICIECDGFNFHHATSQQESRDSFRDQYLRNNNWIIKRFAGTTITSHPGSVKKELQELINSIDDEDKPKQISLI
jgi:hypothetical protein